MAARKFELPGIQELSKDQEKARALPKKGRHLIIGGPGTGKSVIALLRARRYHADGDYTFLVYNRLLHEASFQLIGKQMNSATWKSWFHKKYRTALNKSAPMGDEVNGWREIKWDEVITSICAAEAIPPPKKPFLIIDEGQDMPPEFYEALTNLGFGNFFVVADQNQQITAENSSRRDLENKLDINPKDVIELKENYRNSLPIARLARTFYTGDPASPPPQLPTAKPSIAIPLLVEYGRGCRVDFTAIVARILKMADREPGKLIGVITPNNKVRNRYLKALKQAQVKLDHGLPRIETYASEENNKFSFAEGGIVVINAKGCKGLEFDVVFIADIHEYRFDQNHQDAVKKLFYVMVARAIDRVILLKETGENCPVESILPEDENILGRRR